MKLKGQKEPEKEEVKINTKVINIGKHFNNNEELKEYLSKENLKDITILIKGSHGMHLDEIKDFLVEKYKTNLKAL